VPWEGTTTLRQLGLSLPAGPLFSSYSGSCSPGYGFVSLPSSWLGMKALESLALVLGAIDGRRDVLPGHKNKYIDAPEGIPPNSIFQFVTSTTALDLENSRGGSEGGEASLDTNTALLPAPITGS